MGTTKYGKGCLIASSMFYYCLYPLTFLAKLAFVFLFGVRSVHNPNMLLEILNLKTTFITKKSF